MLAFTGAISPMHILKQMDKQLSQELMRIADIASLVEMPSICLLSDETEITKHTYPGVYRIDVRTSGNADNLEKWIAMFRAKWESSNFNISSTPKFQKKQIKAHQSLLEWMPLYLGKSKDVAKRVLEHINLPLEKTTFALKLKARQALADSEFRLHALEVKVDNYNVIVPLLETYLRNRFHPLIGKQ